MDPYFIVYKTLIQNGPKHETVRENIGERFMKFDLTMISQKITGNNKNNRI